MTVCEEMVATVLLLSFEMSLAQNKTVSMTQLASTLLASNVLFRTIEDVTGLTTEAIYKMLIFIRIQKKIHDLNCSLMSAALSDPVLSELFKLDLLNKSHFECGQWRSEARRI